MKHLVQKNWVATLERKTNLVLQSKLFFCNAIKKYNKSTKILNYQQVPKNEREKISDCYWMAKIHK